jgi:hypothetical protein
MLAFAHLRIDALLAVLIVTACVMSALRVWVTVSKRAVAARDARTITALSRSRELTQSDVPQ